MKVDFKKTSKSILFFLGCHSKGMDLSFSTQLFYKDKEPQQSTKRDLNWWTLEWQAESSSYSNLETGLYKSCLKKNIQVD